MAVYGAELVSVSLVVLLLVVPAPVKVAGSIRGGFDSHWDSFIRSPVDEPEQGTKWAVLVAGSNGFSNYRHQSDVCHAYQILKKGGLKDENIIVFMYDDIANHKLNPRPGVIINRPDGDDVYHGVPKDYTGELVNSENLFAVFLGDTNAVKGGSGKVLNTTRNDRIFLYYSDHGGPGVLGMPSGPFLFAKDFVEVLKKKHKSNSYKEMVLYIEACESGSIFEGLMPKDLNIYVQTASNADESSFATYCNGMEESPPDAFPCLGDLYSVAWMEDSESHNLKRETIEQQYRKVKDRTSQHNTYAGGSHVMEYGSKSINVEKLYLYQGYNPATKNIPPDNGVHKGGNGVVDQRTADLFYLWQKYNRMKNNKEESNELLKLITDTMHHRTLLDSSVDIIDAILFGPGNSPTSVINSARGRYLPLVDDWDCLKSMVRLFESHCGSLTQYGMKHMRSFANICNNKISQDIMEEACMAACGSRDLGMWNPMIRGFSA